MRYPRQTDCRLSDFPERSRSHVGSVECLFGQFGQSQMLRETSRTTNQMVFARQPPMVFYAIRVRMETLGRETEILKEVSRKKGKRDGSWGKGMTVISNEANLRSGYAAKLESAS